MANETALVARRAQWNVTQIPSLAGKIAIVTGANSGIGYETALELARHGAHVILACRSGPRAAKAQEAIETAIANDRDAGTLEFMQLNLARLESVHGFVQAFHAKFAHLDILVNNAGVMYPAQTHTASGLESQFAVNHLGHFYLTHLLFDALVKSPGTARVVTVSSKAHRLASRLDVATIARSQPRKWLYFREYNTSKLANLLFTLELDRRLARAGLSDKIIAVAAHPGVTASDLAPKVTEAYFPTFLHAPLRALLAVVPMFQSAARGAVPVLFAATDASVQSGEYFGPGGFQAIWGKAPAKEEPSAVSRDVDTAAALWKLSEDLANVTFEVAKKPVTA